MYVKAKRVPGGRRRNVWSIPNYTKLFRTATATCNLLLRISLIRLPHLACMSRKRETDNTRSFVVIVKRKSFSSMFVPGFCFGFVKWSFETAKIQIVHSRRALLKIDGAPYKEFSRSLFKKKVAPSITSGNNYMRRDIIWCFYIERDRFCFFEAPQFMFF